MTLPQTEELIFEDHMGSGDHSFRLNYPTLWHVSHDFLSTAGRRLSVTPSIVIPRTILWLDVSKWQGEIDFVVMAEAAPHGLIMKCGQGTARDPQFERNRVESRRVGLPRGTYWFYDSRIPPKQQAALWWEWIKVDTWELMHFADYEENYGGAYGGWQNFKIFLTEFQRLSRLPSSKIGIYTAYYYWISHSPASTTELNYFSQFALWEAWYTTNPANVLIPRPWTLLTLVAWQFGTPPEGHKYGCDSIEIDQSNVNTENEETYRKLFGLDPLPPPGGTMKFGVATGNITIRTGPGIGFPQYTQNGVAMYVLNGDRLESPTQENGFWKLTKLIRLNGTVVTFPADVSVWCGAAFITETPPPDPTLPDEVFTLAISKPGYIPQTITVTLKPQ